MNERATLRDTAQSVKEAWEQSARDQHAKRMADYEKQMKRWTEVEKPKTIAALQSALSRVKKDQWISTWGLRNDLSEPPKKPDPLDCCSPKTKALDGLIELLDTLADDEITATQLNLAGIKKVSDLLRRPC